MSGWNFADVLEVVAREVPDAPAVIQGDRTLRWADMDRRAEALARHLADLGIERGGKVAQYLANSPEYVESLYGCLKASIAPVNTNYRYAADELVYLWTNADVEAVVFHGSFASVIEPLRDRVPMVREWLWVDDGAGPRPDWAVSYVDVVTAAPRLREWRRGGDDLLLLYTGGTTGMPKGVMWRQDDLFVLLGNASRGGYGDEQDLDYARSRVRSPGRRHLPAAPLMHGAGCFSCMPILARGGAVVLLPGRSFDAVELLDVIERDQVYAVSWVGDAFAIPVREALDANPGRWDLSSWQTVTSGGVVFRDEVKQAILRHVPHLLINDVFGASEAITVGSSISRAGTKPARNGSFRPRAGTRVVRPDGTDVAPGSGEAGLIAFAGRQPLGYYKDKAKSDEVFRTIGGVRYSVPGDWAEIDADGVVTLLGRGSACINSGGEKVYPEEVEDVLKRHDQVRDAVVLGVPHERFGQMVVAAVEASGVDEAALVAFCHERLSGYKSPRRVVFVATIGRGPTGKVDLPALRERVLAELGPATPAAS